MGEHFDRGFSDLDENTAPAPGRPIVAGSRKHFGFVPSAVARMVAAPALVQLFQKAIAAFDATSFTPVEREAMVLAMARDVGCHVCIALHGAGLRAAGAPHLVEPILADRPLGDERLDALLGLTRALLEHRGDVPEAPWRRFLAAGYTHAQALEAVLGIGAYTLSMYANRLTGALVDPQLGS